MRMQNVKNDEEFGNGQSSKWTPLMMTALFGSTPRTCDAAHSEEMILENQ